MEYVIYANILDIHHYNPISEKHIYIFTHFSAITERTYISGVCCYNFKYYSMVEIFGGNKVLLIVLYDCVPKILWTFNLVTRERV